MLTPDEVDYFATRKAHAQSWLVDVMTHEDMRSILNENFGIFLARVGSHPFWPARMVELDEWIDHLAHRTRKDQLCVYFYGSKNYGWTVRRALHSFVDDHPSTSSRSTKKGSKVWAMYDLGIEEAKQAIATAAAINAVPCFERLLQKKQDCELDVPCSGCNKKGGDGLRIVCDGKGCDKEFHTTCLDPPLITVPDGAWYCPSCAKRTPKQPLAVATPTASKKSDKAASARKSEPRKTKSPPAAAPTDTTAATVESEERCFLCGLGGELVVCEFGRCTKVYHQLCLGAYPFPLDDDTEWTCPRHTCAISGRREDPAKSTMWHCLRCPLAVDESVLPTNAALTKMSRREKTLLCPHCVCPVAKVRLAKFLERIWSLVATNRQGLPFCGPLLPGVDRPECLAGVRVLDLFQVLSNIRALQYSSALTFSYDIREVVDTALAIVSNRSPPLVEAAKSLGMVVDEQLKTYAPQLASVQPFLDANDPGLADQPPHIAQASLAWSIPWRKECMPFGDKSYVRTDARTLDEWAAYVTSAPVFVDLAPAPAPAAPVATAVEEADPRLASLPPSMTLHDGIDVLSALSGLSQLNGDEALAAFEADQAVLSLSTVEMHVMFKQQAALLRQALQGHAALQHAWLTQQQNLLGAEQSQLLTIGEGRLAAELRLANMNLKARLRAKDELVQQLTADQLALTSRLQAAEAMIAEKERDLDAALRRGEGAAPTEAPALEPETPSPPTEKRRRKPAETPESGKDRRLGRRSFRT
ncbi:hypothetical protein ACHHYP_01114 [Achlya hypogyna]|uniref:PHD-type domain-containing protein n=1 Tax=Achlya hypogyna TaxID=1202772 RepID=A0A1V9Z9D0_ACHHY|nr:hypothetical protein ACHHYP_01114 [Achlya hypogyna]